MAAVRMLYKWERRIYLSFEIQIQCTVLTQKNIQYEAILIAKRLAILIANRIS